MKRFWTDAAVAPVEGGLAIVLDGKPMRIPGGAPLILTHPTLAAAVAAEWQAAGGQPGGVMTLDDVPLTRLAGTAQDRVAPNPVPVIDALARYGETDLLCYRAERPPELALRQARAWQPWLDWAERTHGARLRVAHGIVHVAQDPAALAALHRAVAAQTPAVLAALGLAVPLLGSLVLGLALADGALDAGMADTLAHLDETFQAEQWGEDALAAERRAGITADLALADRFIRLSRGLA